MGVGDQDEAVRELPLHEPAQWSGRRTACRVAWGLTLGWLATFSVLDALLPELIQAEPAPIDPRPIVAFLATHGRDADGQPRWRYLTLGFGEQSGLVQAHTEAGTVDGYFYTARRLPLLTQSGIASLDFSLLWDPEAATLQKLLSDPATHGLRWVFTRDAAYEPFLSAAGWQKGEPLANGVTVWEANGAIPPVLQAAPGIGPLGIWWGITPLAALAASLLLGWWMRPKKVLGPGRGRRDN